MRERLDQRIAVPDPAHGRRRSIYSIDHGAYLPFGVVAAALNGGLSEAKVARAHSCIVAQIDRYRANKRTKVSNDQELERSFGQKIALEALSRLTEEEEGVRNRALAIRLMIEKGTAKL